MRKTAKGHQASFNKVMQCLKPYIDPLAKSAVGATLMEAISSAAIEIADIPVAYNCSVSENDATLPMSTIPLITAAGAGTLMLLAVMQMVFHGLKRKSWNKQIDALFNLVINPSLLAVKTNTLMQYLIEAYAEEPIGKQAIKTLAIISMSLMVIIAIILGISFKNNPSRKQKAIHLQSNGYKILNRSILVVTGFVSVLVIPKFFNLLFQSFAGYEEGNKITASITVGCSAVVGIGATSVICHPRLSQDTRWEKMVNPNDLMRDLGFYLLITFLCSEIYCAQPEDLQNGFLPPSANSIAVLLSLMVACWHVMDKVHVWTRDQEVIGDVENPVLDKKPSLSRLHSQSKSTQSLLDDAKETGNTSNNYGSMRKGND